MTRDVAGAVRDVVGGRISDETIVDYLIAILEDEQFEFGRDGAGARPIFSPSWLLRPPPHAARSFLAHLPALSPRALNHLNNPKFKP